MPTVTKEWTGQAAILFVKNVKADSAKYYELKNELARYGDFLISTANMINSKLGINGKVIRYDNARVWELKSSLDSAINNVKGIRDSLYSRNYPNNNYVLSNVNRAESNTYNYESDLKYIKDKVDTLENNMNSIRTFVDNNLRNFKGCSINVRGSLIK